MAVITFSREAHSGTQDLASLLAERLGYRLIAGEEIAQAVGARSGVRRTVRTLESEGRALSRLEQFGDRFADNTAAYGATLRAVIVELAASDDIVIVGHGAGQVLRDLRTALRVFVVAPVDERVTRVMAEGERDAGRARRIIEREDEESAAYLRYLFRIDWHDPHAWDLVVNTGRVDLSATLDMLERYAKSMVRDATERETLARLQLASRLEEAMVGDSGLGVAALRIRVKGGAVVLEGEALAQEDRERAEAIARELAPSFRLQDCIVVHPPCFV